MFPVQYLAGFQCPPGGLAGCKGQVIHWNQDVYVSNCSKFVYVYNIEKKLIKAVYLFPAEVQHIELVSRTRQLYALCVRSGIYLLTWDEQGRLLQGSDSATRAGGAYIFSIGPDFAFLLDTSICSFIVADEVLVTASVHLKKWKIKIFQTGTLHHEDSFKELEFSIKPPVGHSRQMASDGFDPVLCCVSIWKDRESSDLPCNISVHSSLFTPLFGVDSALLDSPVILCGFPDGQVVFFPLKAAGFPSMHHTESKDQSSAQVMVLYHLEQPVVFIGTTTTEEGAGESQHSTNKTANLKYDCLVILGHSGLMVTLMSGNKSEGRGYVFREYRLQAPVLSAVCSGSGVYYSTCSNLILVNTPPRIKEENETSKIIQHNPVLPSTSYNIPMVVAMYLISGGQEEDVQLLALSNRGKLMLCSLSKGTGPKQWVGLSCSKAGQRIKDLLSRIGTVSERASHLKSVIDQRNDSLIHLNQVMALSRTVLCSQKSEQTVKFSVNVLWTRVVQQDCLVACCSLENKTDCSIERGWMLCINLNSEAYDFRTSYSFPVERLPPGEKTEMSFPLSTGRSNSLDLPITVSCNLFYSLNSLIAGYGSRVDVSHFLISSPCKQSICLLLQDHTIDILHCLRFSSQAGHPSHRVSCQTSHRDPVDFFLKGSAGGDSRIGNLGIHPQAVYNHGVNSTAQLIASVRVSALLLKQTIKSKSSGVSLCCALLHLLSGEMMRTENQSEVQGLTPDGKDVCLRVREVSVSDLSSAGPIPAIELQIASSHLDALACLHSAVLSRLQALILQSYTNDYSAPDLNLGNLKQLFIARESLLKEVQNLRDQLCVEKRLGSKASAQRLLNIYRELRDPGLLLL
ncbi:Fanconi anemia core complex-associated protein 100 [Discoglossus pictus]